MNPDQSPKSQIKNPNHNQNRFSGMVEDENALMLKFMDNTEYFEEYKKMIDISGELSPCSPNKSINNSHSSNSSRFSFSSIEKGKVVKPESSNLGDQQMNRLSLFSPSKNNNQLNQESNIIAKYKQKITKLNSNVLKLNEMLEKSLRKSAALEKENIHLKKRLNESEVLCMKLNQNLYQKGEEMENLVSKNSDIKTFIPQNHLKNSFLKEILTQKFEMIELEKKNILSENINNIEIITNFELNLNPTCDDTFEPIIVNINNPIEIPFIRQSIKECLLNTKTIKLIKSNSEKQLKSKKFDLR